MDEGKPIFPDQVKQQPCSWIECESGHRWPPQMMVTGCPGDQGPYLAIQQQNCPFCNEPVKFISLRVDLVPRGVGNYPRCKGATAPGQTMDVVLAPEGGEQAMSNFRMFLQKQENVDGKTKSGAAGGGDLGGRMADGGVCHTSRAGGFDTKDSEKSGISIEK